MEKLGNYEIIARIGAGGMGEVFRARDTRLGRDVALKLLPPAFADDPDRLARFEREARLLAALNHPGIAAIYGLEHAAGKRFLVLELVAGDDLSARIAQGPIPIEDALPIARDIAEALEYAHEQGIVHRDLKPANIKLTPEGRVKVLDFGLAKALESESSTDPSLSQSPTILTGSPTVAGVILGTAAYMSPEQARGKNVDKRSDVFAFGAVLYEMLTGRQAFAGDTVSDTLAAVIKSHPEATALPDHTPRAIHELLRRCLEKDAKLRLRDIGEARIAIDHARHAGADAPGAAAPAPPVDGAARFRANLVWGVATLAIASAAFFASRLVSPSRDDAPLRKMTLEFDESIPTNSEVRVALSPDGRQIAYILDDRLWIRDLAKLDPIEVPGSEKAEIPFWSADGTQVGYRVNTTFYRVSAAGGASTIICTTRENFTGGSGAVWTPDDRIVFTTGAKGLLAVPALGGDPVEIVAKQDDEVDLHEPDALPGGRGYLFVAHKDKDGPCHLVVHADGARKTLLTLPGQRIYNARYSDTGHILFRRTPGNAGLWALPFSLSALEATGEPFLIAAGGAEPCPGPDGLLVYRAGSSVASAQLAWIGRDGSLLQPISDVFETVGLPALTSDGARVLAVVNEGGNNGDIWVFDLARGTRQRLSFDPAYEIQPCVSPDGKAVYFVDTSAGTIHRRNADGTGEDVAVREGWGPDISPDGAWMVFDEDDNLYVVEMPADSSIAHAPLVVTPADEQDARFSPSGNYLAYTSNESGKHEIYLTRFPGGEGKWQVSVAGGARASWDPGGGRLYFLSDDALLEVDVTEEPELRLGNPRELFKLAAANVLIGRIGSYDVDRGGKRFVMSHNPASEGEKQRFTLVLVENWPAEFAKKTKGR